MPDPGGNSPIPGRPSSQSPPLEKPTEPREPLAPKPDQAPPQSYSPTGQPTGESPQARAQGGSYLTTAQGLRLPDTDHSLKAGPRGPGAAAGLPPAGEDHALRPRADPRAGRARPGCRRARHLRSYGTAAPVTQGRFLAEGTARPPVFVRFSTVLGSRGSADTVRDTRGFAVKFYTDEGIFDLVGNNIPVFFIQDGIKFPDVIHAAKPHPDREIPQAQSRARHVLGLRLAAHRGDPPRRCGTCPTAASPAPTGRWRASASTPSAWSTPTGETTLVKFHWKPVAGVHSLVWEEAQIAGGIDPDFHRRDLADAIEAGAFPEWELGIQVLPDDAPTDLRGHRPARPDQARARGARPGAADRQADPEPQPDELLRRDRAGRLPHRPPRARASTSPTTRCCRPGTSPTSTPSSPGSAARTSPSSRSTARTARSTTCCATACTRPPSTPGVAPYKPNCIDGGRPLVAGAASGGYVADPRAGRGHGGPRAPGVVRRSLHPAAPCSTGA